MPATRLRAGGADWRESENIFNEIGGIGGFNSGVAPRERKTPLLGVVGESITEDCGEMCERVVDKDEDGDPNGCAT